MTDKLKRLVADKNVLGCGRAAAWLAKSPNNQLIITSYLLIECMQRDPIRNLSEDFLPLARFARQLVFLKHNSSMVGVRPRAHGLQNRWIHHPLTDEFRSRLQGNNFAESMLNDSIFVEFASKSQHFLDSLAADSDELKGAILEIRNGWSPALLKAYRSKGCLSTDFAVEHYNSVRDLAAKMFSDWRRQDIPLFSDAIHSFEYRLASACVCLALEWSTGNIQGMKGEKFRNDLLDMNYVAYGTICDGIMTNESKVRSIYAGAKFLNDVAELVVQREARANRGKK